MANLQHHPKYYLAGNIWQPVSAAQLNTELPRLEADDARRSVVLEDAGHRFFAPVDPIWADVFAASATVLVWVRFIILPGPHSMRWTVLRRLWVVVGFVRLFRAVTIQATVLPNPDLDCKPTIRSENIWIEALWLMTELDVTCQDVLYSEHSCSVGMMALFWAFYATHAPLSSNTKRGRVITSVVVKIIAFAYSLLAFSVIIASRFHYSDDVLIAIMVCGLTFATYHFAIRAAPFHRGLFWQMLRRFEGGSSDMEEWLTCASSLGMGLVDW